MSEKAKVTRRTTVRTTGIGIAAAASPAFAKGNLEMPAQELQNPADKYPKPPYKKQSQPWPGLASQMDPRPDHGEEGYRGSGRLAGRTAVNLQTKISTTRSRLRQPADHANRRFSLAAAHY